jgi:hypothetical protein
MLPLKKQDSTVVCSTHTYESTVIQESASKLWPIFRSLSLEKILPNKAIKNPFSFIKRPFFFQVNKVNWLDGAAGQVGSHLEIVWKDGASWKVLITEISDLNHFISYELVEAEPPLGTSSLQATIRLLRVTDEQHTFISWVYNIIYKERNIEFFELYNFLLGN